MGGGEGYGGRGRQLLGREKMKNSHGTRGKKLAAAKEGSRIKEKRKAAAIAKNTALEGEERRCDG